RRVRDARHAYDLLPSSACRTPRQPPLPLPPPHSSTLFPYTTLFRSRRPHRPASGPHDPVSDRRGDRAASSCPLYLRAGLKLDHEDRKSTRLNSSHLVISSAVSCLKKKISATYTP